MVLYSLHSAFFTFLYMNLVLSSKFVYKDDRANAVSSMRKGKRSGHSHVTKAPTPTEKCIKSKG